MKCRCGYMGLQRLNCGGPDHCSHAKSLREPCIECGPCALEDCPECGYQGLDWTPPFTVDQIVYMHGRYRCRVVDDDGTGSIGYVALEGAGPRYKGTTLHAWRGLFSAEPDPPQSVPASSTTRANPLGFMLSEEEWAAVMAELSDGYPADCTPDLLAIRAHVFEAINVAMNSRHFQNAVAAYVADRPSRGDLPPMVKVECAIENLRRQAMRTADQQHEDQRKESIAFIDQQVATLRMLSAHTFL